MPILITFLIINFQELLIISETRDFRVLLPHWCRKANYFIKNIEDFIPILNLINFEQSQQIHALKWASSHLVLYRISFKLVDLFVSGTQVTLLCSGGSRISQMGGGTPITKWGALTSYLAKFSRKTAWKWKKLDPLGGVPGAPRSANDVAIW